MFLAAVSGSVLLARLFALTVIEEEKWQGYADDMSLRAVYETAPRGDITDRNGELIATSKAVYSVNISRVNLTEEKALEDASEVIRILQENGEDVNITQEDVKKAISEKGYTAYMPINIAEKISRETAEEIEEKKYPGVQVSVNYVRDYPRGAFASHIVGYMGRISADEEDEYVKEKGYRRDAMVGKYGIEKEYENILRGEDAVSSLQIDSSGSVKKVLGKSSAVKGKNVKLTIDADLQETAEDALEKAIEQAAAGGTFESIYGDYKMTYAKNAGSGAAVALDVESGEVLALANFPDFDPNDFAEGISSEKWQSLQRKNDNDSMSPAPLYNVATMSAVQPGSTFKPITAMAALDCGLDENRYLLDKGYIELGGRTYGCFLWNENGKNHGYVDLAEALKVSCNYYFYDIAAGKDFASGDSLGYDKKIDNSLIVSYAEKMGLGKKTGIQIPESIGKLPTEKLKNNGIKNSLKNYLSAERETYFKKKYLKNDENISKLAEKISNWGDKDLTLDEIIGKLKEEKMIRPEKVYELACTCKYDYFNQMGWTLGDTFNIAIGQGDNAYTTLQMASYMATLGSGGIRSEVSLIKNSSKNQEKTYSNKENIRYLIDAMTEVAKGDGGSLERAFSDFPYSVAAKTGTAQRSGYIDPEDEYDYIRRHIHLIAPGISFNDAESEVERLMDEYPDMYDDKDGALRRALINLSGGKLTYDDIDAYKEKYDNFAWTVALAPADEPRIAVAVMLVQGKTSANAAPIAREIIGKYGEIEGWEKSF